MSELLTQTVHVCLLSPTISTTIMTIPTVYGKIGSGTKISDAHNLTPWITTRKKPHNQEMTALLSTLQHQRDGILCNGHSEACTVSKQAQLPLSLAVRCRNQASQSLHTDAEKTRALQ